MHQKRLAGPAGGAYSGLPDPLSGVKRVGEGQGKGKERERRGSRGEEG